MTASEERAETIRSLLGVAIAAIATVGAAYIGWNLYKFPEDIARALRAALFLSSWVRDDARGSRIDPRVAFMPAADVLYLLFSWA